MSHQERKPGYKVSGGPPNGPLRTLMTRYDVGNKLFFNELEITSNRWNQDADYHGLRLTLRTMKIFL